MLRPTLNITGSFKGQESIFAAEEKLRFQGREIALVALLFLSILLVYSTNLSRSVITPDGAGYPLVSEQLLPGWLDGKPSYIWAGKLVFEGWEFFSQSRQALIKLFAFYSALFGALASVNIYLVFRTLFKSRYLGGMASMLSAFAPMFFYTAVTIEVYMFNVFWVTLTVLFWLNRRFVLWGMAWGIALASHITSSLLLFPFLWSVLSCRDRNVWRKVFLGGGLTLSIIIISYGWVLSFYSSLPAFIEFYGSISQDDYLNYPTLQWGIQNLMMFKEVLLLYLVISGGILFYFRRQWRKALLSLILFPLLISYLLFYKTHILLLFKSCGYLLTSMSLVAALLLYANRGKRGALIFLLMWAVPYVVLFLGWIQDGGQFYIFLVPPQSLILGGLLRGLVEKPHARAVQGGQGLWPSWLRANGRNAVAASLFLIALSGGLAQSLGTVRRVHKTLGYTDQYALRIKEQIPSGAVVISSWMDPIIKFYAPDLDTLGFPFMGAPLDLVDQHFMTSIRRSLESGILVFITKEWLFKSDDAKTVLAREAIEREYSLVKVNDDIYRIVEKSENDPSRSSAQVDPSEPSLVH